MEHKIIRNDILKSKVISLATLLFVMAASLLVSLAAVLAVNLSGAIDMLMTRAKTPHLMQMHDGDIDLPRLEAFFRESENADDFQVLEFLNIDGFQFTIGGKTLADSGQDNGISVQSEKFDYLLNLDNQIIQPEDGELFVPLSYLKDGTAKSGDSATIAGKPFTVVGFLRDSQMNSTLSSSKRFLVSQNDFEALRGEGEIEYLIEFRLKDTSALGAFETAYGNAGLESNGPTITYPLFRIINAITDGMMIGIIVLISILMVAIAFLCIRFTLLAKIEEDTREIGVMKAIGLRVSRIKGMYLGKYAVIAAAGCGLGFLLSFFFRENLLENIRLYMGISNRAVGASLAGAICSIIIFVGFMLFLNGTLRQLRKMSAVEAMRFHPVQDQSKNTRSLSLSNNKLIETNIFLGIRDVLLRKRVYFTMILVLVIAFFILSVPQNLYNTISSKEFVGNMGIGISDLLINIQQTVRIPEKTDEIIAAIATDSDISKAAALTTYTFSIKRDDGTQERIKIELGNHSVFPFQYFAGQAPTAKNEIALSVMNADAYKKKVGESLILLVDGEEQTFLVSGIYPDVTNGGKSAKANFETASNEIMWTVIYAEIPDQSLISHKVSEYSNRFRFANVTDIQTKTTQMFGSTIDAIGKASVVGSLIALLITALITVLFLKILLARDRYNLVVMKALGFRSTEIIVQYLSRSIVVLIIGAMLGMILANTLGQSLAGIVFSSFGGSTFRFKIDPVQAYLISPMMIGLVMLAATFFSTLSVKQVKISEHIKE